MRIDGTQRLDIIRIFRNRAASPARRFCARISPSREKLRRRRWADVRAEYSDRSAPPAAGQQPAPSGASMRERISTDCRRALGPNRTRRGHVSNGQSSEFFGLRAGDGFVSGDSFFPRCSRFLGNRAPWRRGRTRSMTRSAPASTTTPDLRINPRNRT